MTKYEKFINENCPAVKGLINEIYEDFCTDSDPNIKDLYRCFGRIIFHEAKSCQIYEPWFLRVWIEDDKLMYRYRCVQNLEGFDFTKGYFIIRRK